MNPFYWASVQLDSSWLFLRQRATIAPLGRPFQVSHEVNVVIHRLYSWVGLLIASLPWQLVQHLLIMWEAMQRGLSFSSISLRLMPKPVLSSQIGSFFWYQLESITEIQVHNCLKCSKKVTTRVSNPKWYIYIVKCIPKAQGKSWNKGQADFKKQRTLASR